MTTSHTLYSYFPWIVLFVLVVTGGVLLLLLRSALLPLKAVIVNTLSLAAAFGVMVWIFQDGHLERLLRFDSSGAIEADLPILLFCTRVRHLHGLRGLPADAHARGVARDAGTTRPAWPTASRRPGASSPARR